MCMTFFGRLVRKDVKVEHCVDGLPRGIYIVGKKKNTCRQVECQNDKVKDSDTRECVISCRIPYGWEITHSRVLSFFLKVSVSLLLLSFIPVACGGDAVGVSRRVLYRYVFPVKLPVRPCKVKVSK